MTDDAAAVRDLAVAELGPTEAWVLPKGYPDSLALAAIDAVFSLQSAYTTVERMLDRYRARRRAQGADPAHDSGPDLVAFVEVLGGPEVVAGDVFSRNVAPGTKERKAAVLVRGLEGLETAGITTAEQLRQAEDAELAAARSAWCGVRGLGRVSWDYLLMNVGRQGVKADTWIRRFVTRAVGASDLVSVERANAAVLGAAGLLDVPVKTLDHRIWLVQSGNAPVSPSAS